jgi:hypothetical protein
MVPTGPPATAAAAADPTKIPKTLAIGVWTTQIAAYETVQLAGSNRQFPVNMILGAETTLARMLHEKTVTQLFTAPKLGEVIGARLYTATGQVNTMSVNKSKTSGKLQFSNGDLEIKDDQTWDPEGQWQILDALESLKWATLFCQWGTEGATVAWYDWLSKMVRTHPGLLRSFKLLFTAASWRIATSMRSGLSFDLVTSDIMGDRLYLDDQFYNLAQTPTRKRPWDWTPETPPARPSKGGNRGSPLKKDKPTWPKPPWNDNPNDSRNDECNRFNNGNCPDGDNCKYAHRCRTCKKMNHGAFECRKGQPAGKGSGKEPKGKGKGTGKEPKGKGKGSKQ